MQRNKILCLTAAFSCAILLNACSPKVSKPVAGSDAPAPGGNPHYSAAQLAEGKTIYTSNCGKCHKLFAPADKSLSKWESVLPSMIKKAKLSDEQGALVRAYVMANLK